MSQVEALADATARLARFVSSTRFENLPEEVVRVVKWVTLDTIGVTVAGSDSDVGRAVADLARDFGGRERATVIGTDLRCDPAWAALVNGTTGHQLDYDDQSWTMGGHPSVVLLPPLLALAEDRGAGGRDVILAYAVGFEVASFLGRSVNPDHYGHGWHATGTIGAVAAAAACASLLGLDEEQTRRAISIGASSSAGLRQNFGTSVKPFHAGNAARSGLVAAELARRGVDADQEIIEGRWGFVNVFTPSGEGERSRDLITPGDPWHLIEPGAATKVFPACGATHPGIGAMLELRGKGLEPADVEAIEVRVVDMTERILEYHTPQTGLEAKFSLEYCLARALVSGAVELDHFLVDAVHEPAVTDLIGRTTMIVDPVLTKEWVWGTPRATEITVRLRDGGTMEARADLPPGSPGNFSPEMLQTKFRDCMRRVPVSGSADEVAGAIERLEELEDVATLMSLLRAG